jgi:nucleotide-binding universal stress UspA family protein
MSGYKTIVVHLADERRAHRLLDVATTLARKHSAHLIGLFVMPSYLVSSAFAAEYSRGIMEAGRKVFQARGERIREIFETAHRPNGYTMEWRVVEPRQQPILNVLMMHLRAADLIIASQRDPEWEDTALMEFPETLALETGRPVLVVPNAGSHANFGRRISVAWNERREAARAVFDSLPMLQTADHVRILWVNPESEAEAKGDIPTAELAAALARHGVKCTAAETHGSDLKVGDELLNQLTDDGSDMLVMGAWGHTRLRELVFGGVTRHILRHMTVPVLMSH